MEDRVVSLPNGLDMDVSVTPEFLQVLVDHFELGDKSDVTNDHVRIYLAEALRSAVQKAESKTFHEF
jgi:hypothetical protein